MVKTADFQSLSNTVSPQGDTVSPQGDKVYIENLSSYKTNFSSEFGKFHLEPRGIIGSIVKISQAILEDPWITRALSRGDKFQVISKQEADAKSALLEPEGIVSHEHDEIMKYLGVQDKDKGDMFARDDLEDEAEPLNRGWTAQELHERMATRQSPSSAPHNHSHAPSAPVEQTAPKARTRASKASKASKQPFINPVLDSSVLGEKITDYSEDVTYLNSGF